MKLFRRDAVVEDGVTVHWRHLGFEWWLGFLIWENVDDDDVAHCGWCICVYKDHGHVSGCYWIRKFFFFKFVIPIRSQFPPEPRE